MTYSPIEFRFGSLALGQPGQSNDCPCSSEVILQEMDEIGDYLATSKHNKAKTMIIIFCNICHRILNCILCPLDSDFFSDSESESESMSFNLYFTSCYRLELFSLWTWLCLRSILSDYLKSIRIGNESAWIIQQWYLLIMTHIRNIRNFEIS